MALSLWNDYLDPERVAEETEALLEGGMGGILVLAGDALPPDVYLGEKWFEAVNAVTRRARKRRDSVWIYEDLDSPRARDRVASIVAEHPEYSQSRLILKDWVAGSPNTPGEFPGDAVAAFMVTRDGPLRGLVQQGGGRPSMVRDAIEVAPVLFDVDSSDWPGQRFLSFEVESATDELNYFNPAALTAYLDDTHGRYHQHVKRFFGNTVGLCFLGGAHFSPRSASLPWDGELPALFRETRGYSLLHNLPALFFDVPGCEAVRFDFWTLVGEMFREGTAAAFRAWCEQRRIPCSGHYLGPASIAQATCSVGSLLPLYEQQDFPGVNIPEVDVFSVPADQESYLRRLVAIKEAASVKRQLGKGGVVNEGIRPGDPRQTPDRLRRIAHFELALGLDFVTHHAVRTSLRGDRKFESPPLIGPPDPAWAHFRKHLHALSRLEWILSQGKSLCDVLVLHPTSSIQAAYRHPRRAEEESAAWTISDGGMSFVSIEKHFALLSSALFDAQIDFDYGDEELLARHGQAQGRLLNVGEQTYRIVVLPPMTNLRESTLYLLQDFAMGGGIVIALGSVPSLVDGRPSNAVYRFAEEYAERISQGIDLFDYSTVVQRLTDMRARVLDISDKDAGDVSALKVQRREWEELEIFYVANTGDQALKAWVSFETGPDRHIEAWDPESGEMARLSDGNPDGPLRLFLEWHAGQARLFVLLAGDDKSILSVTPPGKEFRRIEPKWHGSRTEPNVLPLTECRIVDDESVGDWGPLASARSVVQDRIEKAGRPVSLKTEWRFFVSSAYAEPDACSAALELGEGSTAALNGEDLLSDDVGWVFDPAISKVPLPILRPGENVLRVWRLCATAADLQAPWLLGRFSVEGNGVDGWILGREEEPLPVCEWETIGMPFYAGRVVYRADLQGYELFGEDRATLHLPGLMGTAEVRVNGVAVDQLLWPPYDVDITEFWVAGKIEIEIEVAGNLTNLLDAVNPFSCTEAPAARQTVGLLAPPVIIMTSPARKPRDPD
ncbi:MAG: hypothetical protein IID09_02010 [Candidatus Hydrogenedentes bacterium]|nr:hypothetical protein [Candidatus Hydrogenedentota bacterium]